MPRLYTQKRVTGEDGRTYYECGTCFCLFVSADERRRHVGSEHRSNRVIERRDIPPMSTRRYMSRADYGQWNGADPWD